ncbi:hypothetical protein PanWU01x14_149860 [Parasponia andersonii]|uniref:Uncharacterized protein n=1 Tax=Parasponia andersonii TaxID=3476 RepID=A0A2P5CII1_PARAD|nr:hypothetical protein PanWU01x14_149860 [Parasponia andersonii]
MQAKALPLSHLFSASLTREELITYLDNDRDPKPMSSGIDSEDGSLRMSSAGSAPPNSGSSSDGSGPKGKRFREEMRGIAIEKELKRAKVAKLKVQHDEQMGKLVLKHGKMFLNLLAN